MTEASEEKMSVSTTQVINYHQMFKEVQGHVRTLSIQLEEARVALERSFQERDLLRQRVNALEARVQELQAFAADDLTSLSSIATRDLQLDVFMDQFNRMVHGRDELAPLPEKRSIVLSIDMDQFSAINDKHGRAFGDHILQFVARIIISRIRKCDIASRKGQRFTVVLVDCTLRGALMKAREISQRIAAENFGESTGEQIHVTATVGIADYNGKMSREELLRHADCAMKFGKDHGRFCTVVYAKEGGPHDVVESFVRNGKKKA